MKPSKIIKGQFYWYQVSARKQARIYKCERIFFNEAQNQWQGVFDVMTDTSYCNSIGRTEKLNEIEMKRYISVVDDPEYSFKSFESHQKANVEFNIEPNN